MLLSSISVYGCKFIRVFFILNGFGEIICGNPAAVAETDKYLKK
jgi:hypothetical protein